MDNLNFNIEIFKDYRYNLTPEGNYSCPIHDCNSVLELANEQQFPNDNQIKMFWSHVQSAHSDEFENLLKQFSEKTYIPKESKRVSLSLSSKLTQIRSYFRLNKHVEWNVFLKNIINYNKN
ncbi:unnamed protein product [Rotaria magnacalcarata]